MKKCTQCGEAKPLKEFHKSKATKDGLHYYCKKCVQEYHSEYYRTKCLGTTLKTKRIDFHGIKKRVFPISGQCEICNEERRLNYHHWEKREYKRGEFIKGI